MEPIYYDIVPFFTLEKNAKIKEKEKNIFGSSGGHIAYSVAFTPDSKYLLFSTDNKDYSYRYSLNIFSTETNEGFRIPPFTLESFFPFEISISNDCNSFILNTDGINIFYYDLQKKRSYIISILVGNQTSGLNTYLVLVQIITILQVTMNQAESIVGK